MIIYKKNKIVGWINIILGILGCISWYICASCASMEKRAYIYFTSEQDTILSIMLIIMAIPLVLTFIINLVYAFRNWYNKKSMILNILAIIVVITSIVLTAIFETYKCIYINVIIAILGIILLIFNKNEDGEKKHRILFSVLIINILIFIISSIGFILVKSDYEIKYANNEKNLIKNIMQISNGTNTNIPIKAKKNGKWGYISTNGNTVIDFNYDDCAEFFEIENTDTNNKYYIAPVCIGNELLIITNENKQIASYKNTKRDRTINCNYLLSDIKDNLRENAKSINANIKISTQKYDNYYSYSDSYKESKYNSYSDFFYDSSDVLSFDIDNNQGKSIELSYNTKTQSITYNGRKVSIDGYIYIYEENEESYSSKYDYKYLDAYQNGFIPIYNFEQEMFGWIDLKGQTHYINGKIQILDFNDKYIAIKDYSISSDANVCIMNYDGNIVSEYFKEITVLDNGFVVKKVNGKNVYLDENLQQGTQEYDIIDTCKADEGILIVSNLNNSLYDLRFDLINTSNGKVIGKNFEYISGMNEYKYDANYYDNITKNEFKEILCTVDCDYLNTKLYERYYK